MSRIGKIPITVPQGVDVKIAPDMKVSIKGPRGQLDLATHGRVTVTLDAGQIHVARPDDTTPSRAYHGLYQRLLTNMVTGVSAGFKKELAIEGVGYRATKDPKGLVFALGYSHPISFPAPAGITLEAPEPTAVVVTGCDKQLVGQVAAKIRALRKPEPYQGKGIRYKTERIRRKVGKTGS